MGIEAGRIMLQKISLPGLAKYDNASCRRSVFQESHKEGELDLCNYMISRTLCRPRELIQFCIASFEQVSRNYNIIRQEDVEKAETNYSRSRAQDIAAEYRFQFPGLISIFEAFRNKSYKFYPDNLFSMGQDINLRL